MARPNVQSSESPAILPEKVVINEVIMGNGFEHGGGEVAERQARTIISTAKRALEDAEEGGNGKLSMKKSLEWFLESRRKRMAAAAAAGVRRSRGGGEYGSSSSCSN